MQHSFNKKYYSKKTGKITKNEIISIEWGTSKIMGKDVTFYNSKGKATKWVSYDYKNGKYVNPSTYYL